MHKSNGNVRSSSFHSATTILTIKCILNIYSLRNKSSQFPYPMTFISIYDSFYLATVIGIFKTFIYKNFQYLELEKINIIRFQMTLKSWSIWFRKLPIKKSSIVWIMPVHAWSNIVCLTDILHTTYITHYHTHGQLRIVNLIFVATMECSTVAGACAALRRNGTELAAIALAWFTQDGFFLILLTNGPI